MESESDDEEDVLVLVAPGQRPDPPSFHFQTIGPDANSASDSSASVDFAELCPVQVEAGAQVVPLALEAAVVPEALALPAVVRRRSWCHGLVGGPSRRGELEHNTISKVMRDARKLNMLSRRRH